MIALSPSGIARRTVAVMATLAAIALAVVGAATSSAASVSVAPVVNSAVFPRRPTRVLVLGDSVILGAASALPGALPGRQVTMDAVVSRSTGATATAADTYGTDWDVVVILIAHNDGGSPGVYQPPYRRMLDQFGPVPRVVLLTLHQVRPYYATVNQFIRDEAAGRRNVRVADWNAVNSANPSATGGDGLHLSTTGARLMAGLIADQVGVAEFEQIPTTTTAPPTTIAPTTSTEAVVLIPATSIVRSTTTSPPASLTTSPVPSRTLRSVAEGPPLGAPAPSPRSDEGQDTPAWVWPLLATGFAATAALALRNKGTLPR